VPKKTPRVWLMKTEPDVFSIDDLARDGVTRWEGVRNYQARNYMREMAMNDLVLVYHSNAKPPGVVGLGKIVRTAYPDPFQFDPKSDYYDPKSQESEPRWSAVDVGYVETFPRMVTLDALKAEPALRVMIVTQRGSRLSVQPVEREHFENVLEMARRD
jgi:predicted RNA-binding protein with PUA-like domain